MIMFHEFKFNVQCASQHVRHATQIKHIRGTIYIVFCLESKMAIEDHLLPFMTSHWHFECRKDAPPKLCHAIVTY